MVSLHLIHTYQTGSDKALAIAYSPDGKQIAVGSKDGTVQILNSETLQLETKLKQHFDFVYALTYQGDNSTRLISTGKDKSLRLWNTKTGEFLKDYAGIYNTQSPRTMISQNFKASVKSHNLTVLSITTTDDGYMATSGQDKLVKLWKDGEPIRTFDWHEAPVICVQFQPHTRELFSASKDKTIRSWNEITGAMNRKYQGHEDEVAFMRFTSEERFVSGDITGHILAWDVMSEKALGSLAELDAHITCADYNEEKEWLAVATSDGRIMLLETDFNIKPRLREPIATSELHHNAIRSIAFSPDGQTLASCDNGGVVNLWQL